MNAEQYFNELQRSIHELSSMGDLLIYDVIQKKQYDEIYEAVLILHIFHISFFKEKNDLLSNFLERDFNFDFEKNKKSRKQDGAFFTPPYIAQYIVKETIGPLIDAILSNSEIEDKAKAICNLKICDPAMGAAVFLVCAQDFIMQKLIILDQSKYSIEELASMSVETLFGLDINPASVEVAKLIINLNTAKWKVFTLIDEYFLYLKNLEKNGI